MLAVGFGLGLVCKPVLFPEKSTATAGASSAVSNAPHADTKKAKLASADPLPSKVGEREPVDEDVAVVYERARKIQSHIAQQMNGRIRDQSERQISKLAHGLNLTDAQKASLTAWLDDRMAKLGDMDFFDYTSSEAINEVLKTMTSKVMEDQLQASLTPEQKTAFVNYKEREVHAKADAFALKHLSKMQTVVEFEDDQQDEVFKILSEAAAQNPAEEKAAPNLSELMMERVEVDADPYDLGIQNRIMKLGPGKTNKEIAQAIRDAIEQSIQSKVNLLRPVLNGNQLEQYRLELSTNAFSTFGPRLDGMEALVESEE